MISHDHVHIDQAIKTPQFWELWLVLCLNFTAGIGVIGVAFFANLTVRPVDAKHHVENMHP
jgi:hypothetical protein